MTVINNSIQVTDRSSAAQLCLVLFCAAFLIHFVWEMWQIPFFSGMSEANHWSAVIQCSLATLGDGVITLIAYGSSAIVTRNAYWLYNRTSRNWTVYLATGLLITVFLEYLATDVYGRWQYSDAMPIIPILNVGLTPLLQWLALPPLALWLSTVFLRGLQKDS